MLRRWHVLLLILVTLTAFCGLAAAMLRATPKSDRIRDGITDKEVQSLLGRPDGFRSLFAEFWVFEEGTVEVDFRIEGWSFDLSGDPTPSPIILVANGERIAPRGPLERLAWLAGWRS